jgi:hypothetical protein
MTIAAAEKPVNEEDIVFFGRPGYISGPRRAA